MLLFAGFRQLRERRQRDAAHNQQQRDDARKSKDFARSDALRAEIEGMGYTVGDSPQGTVVKKNLL